MNTINRVIITLLTTVFISICGYQYVNAAPVIGFEPGRIIDDIVFTYNQSMNVSQIQNFLNSKVPVCDTWHEGFYGSSGTWYGPPFTCLKDYTENGLSAAQIIYDAAQTYKINPQVLIVLLQKEQSLITDTWPASFQYRSATGYGCPDTAPCDELYYGFTNQVQNAANMFRKIVDASPTWYTPYTLGNNYVQYSPNVDCGGTIVNIQNHATQALYNYTPYQPNQAALDAGYGIGDGCSAYGNRNFYLFFVDWFGSTKIIVQGSIMQRYDQLGGISSALGVALENEVRMTPASWYQKFTNGFIVGSASTGYWESMGPIRDRWAQLGYQTGKMGYPIGPITTTSDNKTSWQAYQNGYIVWNEQTGAWESKGAIREYWAELGYQTGKMGYPTGPETYDGKGWWQSYQNCIIIGTVSTGYWESTGPIRERWEQLGYQTGKMGYPTGPETYDGKGWWQSYQNGAIIGSTDTGYWESKGGIRARWAKLGYQTGKMGYPTGPETYDKTTSSWSQTYQNGAIIGSAITGYWESMGPIRERWEQLGHQTGKMGFPIGPVVTTSDSKTAWQAYQNGYIIWGDQTGAWESKGAIREYWAELGYQTGTAGFPTGNEAYDPLTTTWSQQYQNGTIYHKLNGSSWFTAL